MRAISKAAVHFASVLTLAALSASGACADAAKPSVALLEMKLINDNEGLDPTSDAERARQVMIAEQFKKALTDSGRYTVVPGTDDIKAEVAKNQALGECGGCEVEFGKKLGADRVAWVTVQKISNLILNLNVYMVDVAANKMAFIHSVDIRGNTDETWSRSLKYLMNNYMLIDKPESGNVAPKTQ